MKPKAIKRVKQGRYINEIHHWGNDQYCIMHGEQDLSYGPNCASWSMPYTGLTLKEAESKLKEITQ